MSRTPPAPTWDAATSPEAVAATKRFEEAWRASKGRRPDPAEFLPRDPDNRPGSWLALLRAEMGLRWESGEKARVEAYRERYADLDAEALVALIYEEFCLREESGERPEPSEYEGRFPELVARLRRVFDIHGLLGSVHSTPIHISATPSIPFPEAGQTIAGFRLVEELGRGSFARVFRAEERQLADRPVALKVARGGSREPQTLARLQHTHIVPVHSYRTDPATGLHLLCMPYLGRVTLAQILADEAVKEARSGLDLVATLDRLGAPGDAANGHSGGRKALAVRPYARAIAWWGARLAEALQFAHERGVMHRDVKPSNVLVTGDGMPMLLDFNLAWEPRLDDPELAPSALGGTLAYMAPEHLAALAEGRVDGVDGRADVYSLGVVLYEAMGARPFGAPSGALGVLDTLIRAAEERRRGAPRLRDRFPEVPPALEAVIHKCLEPDPADRYASAADLAADLQAVADDGPLRSARSPLPDRAWRWVYRRRAKLAVAVPVMLALAALMSAAIEARVDDVQRVAEVRHWIEQGERSLRNDDPEMARAQFDAASRLAVIDDPDGLAAWLRRLRPALGSMRRGHDLKAELVELRAKAREQYHLADQTRRARTLAGNFHREAEPVLEQLHRGGGHPRAVFPQINAALASLYVVKNPDWARSDDWTLLGESERTRLLDQVNELLFLRVIASEGLTDTDAMSEVLSLCDRALRFAEPSGPWLALRERWAARVMGETPSPSEGGDPSRETSARACVQWAKVCQLEGRTDRAIAWLERAVELEPREFWPQRDLAGILARSGRLLPALEHFGVAVALRPGDAEARFGRAWIRLRLGETPGAVADAIAAWRGWVGEKSGRRD